jgi:hypothetical protein
VKRGEKTTSSVSSAEGRRVRADARFGLANAEVNRALELARNARDARTVAELHACLDEIMNQPDATKLTRKNGLALLRIISEGLKPSTDKPVGVLDTGQVVVVAHPALALLDDLIDALADLDRGKTHAALKVASEAENAALTTKQRKWDEAMLDAVDIVKRAKGFKTRVEAERFLARNMRKNGVMRRGKAITARTLKRLRDYEKWRSAKKR